MVRVRIDQLTHPQPVSVYKSQSAKRLCLLMAGSKRSAEWRLPNPGRYQAALRRSARGSHTMAVLHDPSMVPVSSSLPSNPRIIVECPCVLGTFWFFSPKVRSQLPRFTVFFKNPPKTYSEHSTPDICVSIPTNYRFPPTLNSYAITKASFYFWPLKTVCVIVLHPDLVSSNLKLFKRFISNLH